MKSGYFITGTDTGVGKTLVACALLHHFQRQGRSCLGVKPVAAGGLETADGWTNEDVASLRRASTVAADPGQLCPYLLPEPVAPHLAAAKVGIDIDLATIGLRFRGLAQLADTVVVEGIGGFRVPLNRRHDTGDLAALLGLPVILVVGLRLGCLNHALLTAEAIASRGLRFAGWVANQIDPDIRDPKGNIEALTERLPCRLIASVPYDRALDARTIEFSLDVAKVGGVASSPV